MDIQQFISYLTEGLDEAGAATVRAAFQSETAKAKVGTLRLQKDFDAIQTRAEEAERLKQELDAVDEKGNPRGYRAWYNKYWANIEANDKAIKAFNAKHGDGAFQRIAAGEEVATGAGGGAPSLKPEDIDKRVHEVIQGSYAQRWSDLLSGTLEISQRHVRNGRKSNLDKDAMAKITELAGTKYNGNLIAAYDEWDKPEAEAAQKAATDALVESRVQEELKKRNTATLFPAGADGAGASSGGMSPLSRGKIGNGAPQYDRSKVIESAVSGKYEPAVN